MDIMGAFIGVDGFQVHQVPDHMVLIRNTVTAMHVPGHPRNVERLATVVPFHQGDVLNRAFVIVHHSTDSKSTL